MRSFGSATEFAQPVVFDKAELTHLDDASSGTFCEAQGNYSQLGDLKETHIVCDGRYHNCYLIFLHRTQGLISAKPLPQSRLIMLTVRSLFALFCFCLLWYDPTLPRP